MFFTVIAINFEVETKKSKKKYKKKQHQYSSLWVPPVRMLSELFQWDVVVIPLEYYIQKWGCRPVASPEGQQNPITVAKV